MTLRLISDIRDCLAKAKLNGRAKFSVLGPSGPEVRCNVLWDPAKGFLLVLSWLNGEKPTKEDTLALLALFASAIRPESEEPTAETFEGLKLLREEYEGAPGSKKMWHQTYSLPKPADMDAKPSEPWPEQLSTAPLPEPGRNDPCPCGSGRKFKKCHGAN